MVRAIADLKRFEELAARIGGGFLRNTVRGKGITCRVCTTPVQPHFDLCFRCNETAKHAHRLGAALADLVVPLVYAIKGAQSGHLMHTYKTRATTPAGTKQLELLCRVGLGFHERCIQQAVGTPITAWAIVPSTNTPARRHLLHNVVLPTIQMMSLLDDPVRREITLVPGPEFRRTPREWVPGMWTVAPGTDPAQHHVLLLDDTWTTGGNAQSAATALHEAGASAITISTLARWLDRNRDRVPEFIAHQLVHRDLDLLHCPASSTGCPTPF